jgi:hypothetical protein
MHLTMLGYSTPTLLSDDNPDTGAPPLPFAHMRTSEVSSIQHQTTSIQLCSNIIEEENKCYLLPILVSALPTV